MSPGRQRLLAAEQSVRQERASVNEEVGHNDVESQSESEATRMHAAPTNDVRLIVVGQKGGGSDCCTNVVCPIFDLGEITVSLRSSANK